MTRRFASIVTHIEYSISGAASARNAFAFDAPDTSPDTTKRGAQKSCAAFKASRKSALLLRNEL